MEQTDNKRTLFSRFLPALIILVMLMGLIYNNTRLNDLEQQGQISSITNRYGLGAGGQTIRMTNSQIVYVPVYSHINTSSGEPRQLEVTISIRNSDPEKNITLLSAQYYNTEGKSLQNYYKESRILKPLQSTEILLKKSDTRGGSGANFIIEWKADTAVYEPIIEAVMIANSGNGLSFKSFGRPLSQRRK
jgi:hypothetical protein